jgi:hypothetical protein
MCVNSKQIRNEFPPKHAPNNCDILIELWYDLDESDSEDNDDDNDDDDDEGNAGDVIEDDGCYDEDYDERRVALPIAYIPPTTYAGYNGVPDGAGDDYMPKHMRTKCDAF